MTQSFCKYLQGVICNILNENCFRRSVAKPCEFKDHYNYLLNYQNDPPSTQLVKNTMMQPFLDNWRGYAISPSSGKKNMTGMALERTIRKIITTQLSPHNVSVYHRGKKIEVWIPLQGKKGVKIIADVFTEKENFPSSIISVKSWLGPTQIRETFTYAYFSKSWFGHRNVRVFMVTLYPIKAHLQPLMDACKPYIDGFYSLTGTPYFDNLILDLKNMYK